MFVLVSCASETACSLFGGVVVGSYAVRDEDALHECVAFVYMKGFVSAVCAFCENMTFVFGVIVVRINDGYGVFEAQTVFETVTASWE